MRIDRERFLLAAAALAVATEQAESMASVPFYERLAFDQAPIPVAPVAFSEAHPAPEVHVAAAVAVRVEPPPPVPISEAKKWFLELPSGLQTTVTALCKYRAANPCADFFRSIRARRADLDAEDPELQLLAALTAPQQKQATAYCTERAGRRWAPSCETPLVAAFDGQPIEFRTSPGEFAFVPGKPALTDWPSAATPWIARDLDGDHAITSGAELFGSSTAIASGTARNGFEALAELDANHDDVIDHRDPAFAELLLWSDRDGDRRSSPDELRPLASAVTAIPLAHALDARCTDRDNCEGERGTLRWRDDHGVERSGAVVDVYLRSR